MSVLFRFLKSGISFPNFKSVSCFRASAWRIYEKWGVCCRKEELESERERDFLVGFCHYRFRSISPSQVFSILFLRVFFKMSKSEFLKGVSLTKFGESE